MSCGRIHKRLRLGASLKTKEELQKVTRMEGVSSHDYRRKSPWKTISLQVGDYWE